MCGFLCADFWCGFLARIFRCGFFGADFWCGFFGADFFGADFGADFDADFWADFLADFFLQGDRRESDKKKKSSKKSIKKSSPKFPLQKSSPKSSPNPSQDIAVGPQLDSKEMWVHTVMPLWRLAPRVVAFWQQVAVVDTGQQVGVEDRQAPQNSGVHRTFNMGSVVHITGHNACISTPLWGRVSFRVGLLPKKTQKITKKSSPQLSRPQEGNMLSMFLNYSS